MGGACHNAEVMEGQSGADLSEAFLRNRFQPCCLLISHADGIHMYHGMAAELVPKLMLDGVDHVMEGQKLSVRRDFRVKGDQYPAGAVIVHD